MTIQKSTVLYRRLAVRFYFGIECRIIQSFSTLSLVRFNSGLSCIVENSDLRTN